MLQPKKAKKVLVLYWLFFFQAEDGIRDYKVTGVQTCALPIYLVDVLVPDGMGGGFHVDFLLLTARGVVVIDLRDVTGNIFGGDQMAAWTVMDGPHRFTFTNPQSALYDRIAAVKAVAGEVPVEGRIVFTLRGRFPKGLPKWTLMLDGLRAEFPSTELTAPSESDARIREGWQRLKEAVKPSYMGHMRHMR